MEQLPLNLQSHLCQLGFVLLRELVGTPFTNGDEPFWKVSFLLKIKLANSPLVLLLHHLADHCHSLLSASCHCWLVQLRKNLVRCCIECMNTWIEDCTFLEPLLITSGLRLIKSAVEVSLFSFPFSSIQPSWYRTHQSPVVVCKRCWSTNMSVICFEL